jgi:Transposase, Mutator family
MAEQLSQGPDLLRQMVQIFAEALMSADADAVCRAGYGQRSLTGGNIRNGNRWRGWDTRAGSIELAVAKLRERSYFPGWFLERRRRAGSAPVSVVATSYLLSTRRMEKLVHLPSEGQFRLPLTQPPGQCIGLVDIARCTVLVSYQGQVEANRKTAFSISAVCLSAGFVDNIATTQASQRPDL